MQKAMSINVSIVSVKWNDRRFYFQYTNKDEAINIMKNSDYENNKGKIWRTSPK